ncbi:MAG: OB-fold domain-containing protein [Rhodocyclales bacterium]|nr:OB-fold domain-containing protein [Rhodocyclales bacterium]
MENHSPCVPGLFEDQGGVHLLGARCVTCGTPYFPRQAACRNPHCGESKMEDCSFSGRGTVWSYSVADFSPPAPFKCDPPFKPYVIAVVDLENGLRIVGQMMNEFEEMKVGALVELVIDTLYHEGDVARTTWKFKPAGGH